MTPNQIETMMEDGNLIRFIIAVLFSLPLFLVILSGPIVDWLSAREKRKKTAAASSAGVATSSPSTPEPA